MCRKQYLTLAITTTAIVALMAACGERVASTPSPVAPTPTTTPAPATSTPVPPTRTPTAAAETSPSTSERLDATGLIVFSQAQPTGADSFIARSGGADPIRPTDLSATEVKALWSPDASRIAYLRKDPGTDGVECWILDPKAPGEAKHGASPQTAHSHSPREV